MMRLLALEAKHLYETKGEKEFAASREGATLADCIAAWREGSLHGWMKWYVQFMCYARGLTSPQKIHCAYCVCG